MKLIAYGAGRRFGNTEVLIKEALMAAEEMGVEVEYIRLNELNLGPCRDCTMGPCYVKGPGACIWKDDGEWLSQKFLESDGYILGAPVWSLSPAGIVTVFRDRVFGPKMDMAAWEIEGIPEWAHGQMKRRPGALISVGGAITKNWTSLGMATLYTTTFSAQTEVVDYMDVNRVADPGAMTLREDLLERARQLGRNVAYAMLHPDEEHHWLGEQKEEPSCPGCRQNLMITHPGTDVIECAICGNIGKITMEDGGLKITWPVENKDDRLKLSGKYTHQHEIAWVREHEYEPYKEQAMENLKKYKDYESCVVKPPRAKK